MIRVRFATAGALHIGSARLALITWLFARRHKGAFVLRIDDAGAPLDAEPIAQELRWLSLDPAEVHRQSDHTARYAEAAERLKAAGRLYPCFESVHELEAKRDQRVRRGKPPVYDRAMLRMTADQRARAEAGGKVPYWRFRLSDSAIAWDDLTLRRQEVKLPALSDPILLREDGTPSALLTSAVDDLAMGITHLIRGAEQAEGTAMQLDIAAALGARPSMLIAHLPALSEGGRGGKRPEGLSLRQLRTDGVEPAAIATLLATLGTPHPAVPTTLDALAAECDLRRFGAAPFAVGELLEVNRLTLAGMQFAEVAARLPEGATERFWMAVRGHIDLLPEARGWWDVVAGEIVPPVMEGEGAFLAEALALLPQEPWSETIWDVWTRAVQAATGRDAAGLAETLNLALTGEEDGPAMADLLPLIGRARAARRLEVAAC